MEIAGSILVVIPQTRLFGPFVALGIMSGAIFFHLVSPLGIDPYYDGGALFKEALAVLTCAAFILVVRRDDAIGLVRRCLAPRRGRA